MRVSCNVDEVRKQFDQVVLQIEGKLKNMVVGFAHDVAREAVDANPLGSSPKFADLYALREQRTGLQPIEGFSRGSWQASTSWPLPRRETYGEASGDNAVANVPSELSNYKLGQTVYIGNTGPYIETINSRFGIADRALLALMQAYSSNLKYHYDRG